MPHIPHSQIEWLTGFLFDNTGRVFRHEGEIYRAIYPSAVPHIEKLLSSGILEALAKVGHLIPTHRTDLTLDGFPLVLHHRRIPFITAATEWCRPLLRDAGRAILDLNIQLAHHHLATIDAHPGNIGQIDACKPVWIDIGSIAPLTTADMGLAEFRRFFTHPLHLAAHHPCLARLTRALNYTGGLTSEEYDALTTLKNPLQQLRQRFTRHVRKKASPPSSDPKSRIAALQAARDQLDTLHFPTLKTTWGDYHPGELFQPGADLYGPPRRASILRAIETLRPRRVIDLASNAGFYSLFCARLGAEVLALDYDEAAVERLYTFMRSPEAGNTSLTCACGDVTRPTTLRNPLPRQGDLVLALALMHHLALSQGCSFEKIVSLLHAYCTDSLLVEFMPCGLGGTTPRPDPLPEWYRQDAFLAALANRFHTVQILAEHREPQWRVLIHAQGPKAGG